MEELLKQLKNYLKLIEENDPSSPLGFKHKHLVPLFGENYFYNYRNDLVYRAVQVARELGFKAGYLVHQPVSEILDRDWEYYWGVVAYIELPTGQVSWHIESPHIRYDGHTHEDKTNRINDFISVNPNDFEVVVEGKGVSYIDDKLKSLNKLVENLREKGNEAKAKDVLSYMRGLYDACRYLDVSLSGRLLYKPKDESTNGE